MDLTNLTLKETSEGLKSKKFSSVDLTKAYFERIKKLDKNLHAYVLETEEQALKDAENADKILTSGKGSALTGIPCALKDNFNTKGVRTTCCSRILENFIPPYDATVVKKLKEAGVVILGKTNSDEFTCGGSTEHSCFGPTSNPWDVSRVAGGSSGGSACAVAADMATFALGTDTGGSIREPASFCGCVGLKVTYGRTSRYGVMSMASSFDTIGTLARSVEDAAIILQAIAGKDPLDATTSDVPVPDYRASLQKPVKGLKIGLPKEYFIKGMSGEVEKAVR